MQTALRQATGERQSRQLQAQAGRTQEGAAPARHHVPRQQARAACARLPLEAPDRRQSRPRCCRCVGERGGQPEATGASHRWAPSRCQSACEPPAEAERTAPQHRNPRQRAACRNRPSPVGETKRASQQEQAEAQEATKGQRQTERDERQQKGREQRPHLQTPKCRSVAAASRLHLDRLPPHQNRQSPEGWVAVCTPGRTASCCCGSAGTARHRMDVHTSHRRSETVKGRTEEARAGCSAQPRLYPDRCSAQSRLHLG